MTAAVASCHQKLRVERRPVQANYFETPGKIWYNEVAQYTEEYGSRKAAEDDISLSIVRARSKPALAVYRKAFCT